MGQTFSGTLTTGVLLSATAQNPATIAAGAYVANSDTTSTLAAGVVGNTYVWTVVNLGIVEGVYKAPGTIGTGILLNAGGLVVNGASGAANAEVDAPFAAIQIKNAAGTVVNYGLLNGEVSLAANSIVRNLGTVDSSTGGIAIAGGGTVVNSGTISAFSGVALTGSHGTVTNSGRIAGSQTGVALTASSSVLDNAGGTITGATGAQVSGTVINSGLIAASNHYGVVLLAGSLGNTGTIESGQKALYLSLGSSLSGESVVNHGLISGAIGIAIGGSAANTIDNFGTIAGTLGTAVSLGGGNDRLVIETGSVLQGAVGSLHPGDQFDLPFMAFSGAGKATVVSNGTVSQTLDVIENGSTFAIALLPTDSFAGDIFQLGTDGSGGTLVTEEVACFCRGTMILTPAGEVPVERLAIGGLVETLGGAARPIKWIGRRSYSGRFAHGQKQILPVCIKAGALADGVPRRDLWISPNHALYLEGVLIEVHDLIDGVAIRQAATITAVEYFHLELASHDLILAEGTATETYLDNDNRQLFHNAREYRALYPESVDDTASYCAPRRSDGWEVERARRLIAVRCGLPVAAEAAAVGTLRGQVDEIGARLLCGWAQDERHPETPVCLEIRAEGRLIGQIVAGRYRADLEAAGLGSGRHGFVFVPPGNVRLAARSVDVRRSADGAVLRRPRPHSARRRGAR